MKKIIFGLITFAGVFVIVGSLGAMEQDTVTIAEALLKSMQGLLLVAVAWTGNLICGILSTVKRSSKKRAVRSDNVLKFSA